MVVRSFAAPPTPWSKSLAQPNVHETAYVHSFSNIIGDVHVGPNALVAPGTSIRADEGGPFQVGEGSNIQEGVVIHGMEKGRVLGDDGKQYSVWIGKNTSITHMALIHGPAYVGEDCFIGFRSTVFNARVGQGCIVMMHVLIQDVEIPPGKYVPSGSIITTQQQADRLPDVNTVNVQFASHVVGINDALRSGYHGVGDVAQITPNRQEVEGTETVSYSYSNQGTRLTPDVVNQVRQLLSQGYRIGMEHADARRFQTSSWSSCSSIQSTRDSDVLAALEACLAEHPGEYVRVLGIDTKNKRRVSELIIQRPGDSSNGHAPQAPSYSQSSSSYSSAPAPSGGGSGLSGDVVSQVRSLLSQGYRVAAEYADARRFQTSSWKTCGPIDSTREADVVASLQSCMAAHGGEYVRLYGVDTKSKRRVAEMIIQRPGDAPTSAGSASYTPAPSSYHGSSSGSSSSYSSNGAIPAEAVDLVRNLLNQGLKIGTEHANARRFQTSSWYTCSPIQATRESEAIGALEACLREHSGEYVRMFGIDTKLKRRVSELIIQRP